MNLAKLPIKKGADVNAKKGLFFTPLHTASYHGRKDLAEMLIDKGAEINTRGGPYGSPLVAAMTKGHPDITEMLISRGAHNHVSYSWQRSSGGAMRRPPNSNFPKRYLGMVVLYRRTS